MASLRSTCHVQTRGATIETQRHEEFVSPCLCITKMSFLVFLTTFFSRELRGLRECVLNRWTRGTRGQTPRPPRLPSGFQQRDSLYRRRPRQRLKKCVDIRGLLFGDD